MQSTPPSTLSNIRQAYSFLGRNSLSSVENKQCKIEHSFSGRYAICHCVAPKIFRHMKRTSPDNLLDYVHKMKFMFSLLASIAARVNTFVRHKHKWKWHSNHFKLTLILRRSRTGTLWFYTSTSKKRAAPPKLYTKSLTRDLKRMYSRFTLVRISIKL